MIHENSRQSVTESIKSQFETKGRFDAEFQLADSHKWVHVMGVKMVKHGEVFIEGFMQDISLRRLAEQKLSESERQFRTLADGMPNLLWLTDKYSETLFFNKTWLDYTGQELDDALETGWLELVHPNERNKCMDTLINAQETLSPYEISFRLKDKSGIYRWMLCLATPRFNQSGTCEGFISVASDISERIRLEDEINEHRLHLQSLVEDQTRQISHESEKNVLLRTIVTEANLASNLEMAIQSCIGELCKFTGYELGHCYLFDEQNQILVESHIWAGPARTHSKDEEKSDYSLIISALSHEHLGLDEDDNIIIKAFNQAKPVWIGQLNHKNAGRRYDLLHLSQIKGQIAFPLKINGHIYGVIELFSQDILLIKPDEMQLLENIGLQLGRVIERFTQEANLIKARDQAEESARVKAEFLSNMSHELRTPMHAILNYAGLSLKRLGHIQPYEEAQKLDKFLSNIQNAGQRLLGLLNNLLDLAKLDANKMNFSMESYDLRPIIEHTQMELASLVHEKHIKLVTQYNCASTIGIFDKQRLIQVFVNLYANAIKFSPIGSQIRLDIESCQHNSSEALLCRITDEGQGIPIDELDKIFEAFMQSRYTKSGSGGTGLGLSICRQIIEAHGGRIWAVNTQKGGAAFNFIIPLTQTLPKAELQKIASLT